MNQDPRVVNIAEAVSSAVVAFGENVTPRFAPTVSGEAEDKLRGPFETFLRTVGLALQVDVTTGGESKAGMGLRSDYAIYVDGALTGHVELKAPGKGADPTRFTGHDRRQWEKSQHLPNLLYTDGNSWSLHRGGEPVGKVVTLHGDVRSSSGRLRPVDGSLAQMLTNFLRWKPLPPRNAAELACSIGGLCRLLRDQVIDVLREEGGLGPDRPRPFAELAGEWRELLFPTATDAVFADSYAQTVAFAFLLARSEGIGVADIGAAADRLGSRHGLLGRALRILTDNEALSYVSSGVEVLQRVIGAVDWTALNKSQLTLPGFERSAGRVDNPWLYFYEEFLTSYDPELRKNAGAYYTPGPVVAAQVALVDDILRSRLGKKMGYADDGVVVIDPAMGTGSYLVGIVEKAAQSVRDREGEGAVAGRLELLSRHLIGFEIMTGPYAVAELQLSEAFRHHDVDLPDSGLRTLLADTLSNPYVDESHFGGMYEPIARSRRAADSIKKNERVLVCIGNPPYDRHSPGSGIGGWVRYGNPDAGQSPIIDDFRAPGIKPAHIASLYNLYVYFWRWGLWKVLEVHKDSPQGVVAFITSSSFLDGPGFAEMRAHMRRTADEIWVVDLGGEGRGAQREENVFAIQTPVAITICVRSHAGATNAPAVVNYARLTGNRQEKLDALRRVGVLGDLEWRLAADDWQDPFNPAPPGQWLAFPSLFDLIPWRLPGIMMNRTWPVAPDDQTLRERWTALVTEADVGKRRLLFKEDVHRTLESTPNPIPGFPGAGALRAASVESPTPAITTVGWRSFDRQRILADSRLITLPRPDLWSMQSEEQLYLTTLNASPFGAGPAITATAYVPDKHHFHGRGGAILPMWLDASSERVNVCSGLPEYLSELYGSRVSGPDIFAYIVGVCGQSGYTARYGDRLGSSGPRVPITRDAKLFAHAAQVGSEVLWLQTFGERYFDENVRRRGDIPVGDAKMIKAVPLDEARMPAAYSYDESSLTLRVGEGELAPVAPQVWRYEVSGMRVVAKWLGYRMREPAGKRASPLNAIVSRAWRPQWSTELLSLLWVLERLMRLEPEQAALLKDIADAPLVTAGELEAAGILGKATKLAGSRKRPRKRGQDTSLLE